MFAAMSFQDLYRRDEGGIASEEQVVDLDGYADE